MEAEPSPRGVSKLDLQVPLRPTWDSSLTYDSVEAVDGLSTDALFVGRETLVGPLVNAVSQPAQRGTYLISGYRGVGKTSLVIQAMRLARDRLRSDGWTLFPLILNVSEVSASLGTESGDERFEQLRIDARKLLTALLRAVRNRLDADDYAGHVALRESVEGFYKKAQATTFTQTQDRTIDVLQETSSKRETSIRVENLLKLLSAVLVVVGGVAGVSALLGGSITTTATVALTLAALAAITFGASKVVARTASDRDVSTARFVYDNSLHQLESELKDVLSQLHRARLRTVIVLEELDKIDDQQQGQQLESVIRYFKNLFTQAPALFFFITDKRYFDNVVGKIDEARSLRTYAIEHTFFTHRVFVTRSGLDECLAYLHAIVEDEGARAALRAISETRGDRLRKLADMAPFEQCFRVLLFRSQDHFFDLKNMLAQFVRINESRITLAFNDTLLSRSDLGLAAFHFILEQHLENFYFGGGKDYANEALRSSLFAVFDTMGSEGVHSLDVLDPVDGPDGDRLNVTERRRIRKAVESLLEDLRRGGSVEIQKTPSDGFRWNDTDPALRFVPSARLLHHEESLVASLSEMAQTAAEWGTRAGLRNLVQDPEGLVTLSQSLMARADDIRYARAATPLEESESRRAAAESEMALFLDEVISKHVGQVRSRTGFELIPLTTTGSANVYRVASGVGDDESPAVFLQYASFRSTATDVRVIAATGADRLCVVRVGVGPRVSAPSEEDGDLTLLGTLGERLAVSALIRLDEDHEGDLRSSWGQATADQIIYSVLWMALMDATGPAIEPPTEQVVLVSRGREPVRGPLAEVMAEWLPRRGRSLAWVVGAGPERREMVACLFSEFRVALADPRKFAAGDVQRQETVNRLFERNQVFWVPSSGVPAWKIEDALTAELPRGGRALLPVQDHTGRDVPPWRALGSIDFLHAEDLAGRVSAVADLVAGTDPDYATALLRPAAAAGDIEARIRLAALLVRTNREESREWQAKTVQLGTSDDQYRAAEAVAHADPEGAVALWQAAALAGHTPSMVALAQITAGRDVEESRRWQSQLLKAGTAEQLDSLAEMLATTDPEGALDLTRAAAKAGAVPSMSRLALMTAGTDLRESRTWQALVMDVGASYEQKALARDLVELDRDGALALYRRAAESGDGHAADVVKKMTAQDDGTQ